MLTLTDIRIDIAFFVLHWIHIVGGVVWLGMLYYAVLVAAVVTRDFDTELRRRLVPTVVVRVLWWRRWSALASLLAGWGLFLVARVLSDPPLAPAARGWLTWGGAIATLMGLNLWLVIGPAQSRLLRALEDREPVAEAPTLGRRVRRASLLNGLLSLPMLGCMVAARRLILFSPCVLLLTLVLGAVLAWLALAAASGSAARRRSERARSGTGAGAGVLGDASDRVLA